METARVLYFFMGLRLLIFDLDGTLVDTCADITNSLNHALSPFGVPAITEEKTAEMVGDGITNLIKKASGFSDDREVESAVARFLEHYSAHLTDFSRPYPDVAETLGRLGGFKKAVISNKRESLSVRLLRELGLADYFELVVGGDSTKEKKPSPMPVRYVLRELGVSPEEAVMIGDSPNDVRAAKAAGARAIAVTYGYRPKDTLMDADYIIDAISELPEVLNKIP